MKNFRSRHDGRTAARRSAQIDRQIKQDAKRLGDNCKVLLYGLSDSGKSTIIKRMRIAHQGGFCHDAKIAYREAIYSNLLESAQAIAAALRRFRVEPADPSNVKTLELVLEYDLDAQQKSPTCPSPFVFPRQLAEAIYHLWRDQIVPDFVDFYGARFDLMDSAAYFCTEARRIASVDYVPTETDILRCRQRTAGVIGTSLNVPPLSIHLLEVDSSGPPLCKRWMHYFESITSIIFCTALSDYDRMIATHHNRMVESIILFDSLINSSWFSGASVILLLNKIDIFRHKLPRVPLEQYFQEYTGGPNVDNATKYILGRFKQGNRANLSIYPHVTEATDLSDASTRLIVAAVSDTIIRNTLKGADVI